VYINNRTTTCWNLEITTLRKTLIFFFTPLKEGYYYNIYLGWKKKTSTIGSSFLGLIFSWKTMALNFGTWQETRCLLVREEEANLGIQVKKRGMCFVVQLRVQDHLHCLQTLPFINDKHVHIQSFFSTFIFMYELSWTMFCSY